MRDYFYLIERAKKYIMLNDERQSLKIEMKKERKFRSFEKGETLVKNDKSYGGRDKYKHRNYTHLIDSRAKVII